MNEHPDLKVSHPARMCLEYTGASGTRMIRADPDFCSYVMDLIWKCDQRTTDRQDIKELRETVALYADTLGIDGHAPTVAVLRAICDLVQDLRTKIHENSDALADAALGLSASREQQNRLMQGFSDAKEGLRELENQIDSFRVEIRRREGIVDQLCSDHTLHVHNVKAQAALAADTNDLAIRRKWADKFGAFVESVQHAPMTVNFREDVIRDGRTLADEFDAEVTRAERRIEKNMDLAEGEEDPDDD